MGALMTQRYMRFRWTPHFDDAVRRAYAKPPRTGAVLALARTLALPYSTLRRRAMQLDCLPNRQKRWTPEEIELLRENEGKHPETLRRTLRRAGHVRSERSVNYMLRRLGLCTRNDDQDSYTPPELAHFLGCNERTVRRWIEDGRLECKSVMVNECANHHITRKQTRTFLIDYPGLWDVRRVDGLWLVDIIGRRLKR